MIQERQVDPQISLQEKYSVLLDGDSIGTLSLQLNPTDEDIEYWLTISNFIAPGSKTEIEESTDGFKVSVSNGDLLDLERL
jgi:uncharacterized metal-binding protein YceD (DUF177 family)